MQHALPLFATGALRAVIDAEFALQDIGNAHALMESNATTGKIVLCVDAAVGEAEASISATLQ